MVLLGAEKTFLSLPKNMNNDNSEASKNRSSPATVTGSLENSSRDEDGQLVERALHGQAEAFEALFLKYRQRVFGVAWRLLRNEDSALDVVQDAFVKAYEQLERLRGDAQFFPWLRRIAINLAIDHLRHIRRGVEVSMEERTGEDGDETPLTSLVEDRHAESPVEEAEQAEFKGAFSRAVERLSERHRIVFLLSAEGLTYREIAEYTHCNVGTVMSRLFYARKQLQDMLKVHLK